MNIMKIYSEEIFFMNITNIVKTKFEYSKSMSERSTFGIFSTVSGRREKKILSRAMCLYLGTILLNVLGAK